MSSAANISLSFTRSHTGRYADIKDLILSQNDDVRIETLLHMLLVCLSVCLGVTSLSVVAVRCGVGPQTFLCWYTPIVTDGPGGQTWAARVRDVVAVEGHHVAEHVRGVAVVPVLPPLELQRLLLGQLLLHTVVSPLDQHVVEPSPEQAPCHITHRLQSQKYNITTIPFSVSGQSLYK